MTFVSGSKSLTKEEAKYAATIPLSFNNSETFSFLFSNAFVVFNRGFRNSFR